MSYTTYKQKFTGFNSAKGYVQACRFLAFDNNQWDEFGAYREKIERFLQGIKTRVKRPLIVADFCSGEYAWIARHFAHLTSKIYCIDVSKEATSQATVVSSKVEAITGDAQIEAVKLSNMDAIYCGFNVYPEFINGFMQSLRPGGGLFLMKPKEGDDISLRELTKGYDSTERKNQIQSISNQLGQQVKYQEERFHWRFLDKNIEDILAAISVVGLGESELLSQSQYETAINYLRSKQFKGHLVLTQTVAIWQGEKHES